MINQFLVSLFIILISSILSFSISSDAFSALLILAIYSAFLPLFFFDSVRKFTLNLLFSFSLLTLFSSFVQLYTLFHFDVLQTTKDSEKFLELLHPYYFNHSLSDLRYLVDSTLAVKIWQKFYFFSGDIIVPNAAITINSLFISLSIAILVQINKLLGGRVRDSHAIYIILLSGIPLQFGTLLLRDSYLFFSVSVVCLGCVLWFYRKISLLSYFIIMIIVCNLVIHLRDALVLIIIAFFVSSIFYKFNHRFSLTSFVFFMVILFGVTFLGAMITEGGKLIVGYASERADTYQDLALSSSSEGSLGVSFIYNQPFFLRIIFASALLIIGLVPSWLGFIWGANEYTTFLSIYSFFMIATFPVFLRGMLASFKDRNLVSFFSLWYISGLLLIASTSIELRHIGQFLPLYLIAILLFIDRYGKKFFNHRLNFVFYIVIAFLHLFWTIVKFI